MRKFSCIWGLACFIFLWLPATAALAETPEPVITAESAILIEASTGRVIYEKQADKRLYPASMTKMMTCLLAERALGARHDVIISQNAAETEDIPLEFAQNDVFLSGELIRGMMLASDNGAAVALAEASAGSVADFVAQMNSEAKKIGMTDTHFANPNGLTNPDHYSTAADMAKLARYAMQEKSFREIVGTAQAVIHWELPRGETRLEKNTNELLTTYSGATGIKTGWTEAAGGCLAASARRGGLELICIVMKSATPADRFQDARKILDYGFAETKLVQGIKKENFRKSIWVKGGKQGKTALHPVTDVNFPLIHGEDAKGYTIRYDLPKILPAPLKKNEPVGQMVLQYDGKEVGRVDMVVDPVEQGTSFSSLMVGIFGWLLPRL